MAKVWHPLGGNGGIPSDVMTNDIAGERKLKVTGLVDDGLTAIDPDGNEYVVTIPSDMIIDDPDGGRKMKVTGLSDDGLTSIDPDGNEYVASIPSDMITTRESGLRSLSVASLSRQEIQMAKGSYVGVYSRREAVPIDNTYAVVVRANEFGVAIEDINSIFDFTNTGDGRYSYSLVLYYSNSNDNTFTYSGGVTGSLGKPLTGTYINEQSNADLIGNVTVDTLTGDPDHLLRFVDYFLDTQGSKESVSDTGGTFFSDNRKLIIPPGVEVLIVAETGGDANGTASITTSFFSTEVEGL